MTTEPTIKLATTLVPGGSATTNTPVPDDPAVRERALIVAYLHAAADEDLARMTATVTTEQWSFCRDHRAWAIAAAYRIQRGDHLKEPTP